MENRARFLLEVIEAIKAKMPVDRYIIAAKINCHDCEHTSISKPDLSDPAQSVIPGGLSFAESCVVLKWLEQAGVDFFDVSGGTYESPAWRGNIMKELLERESQKTRGRLVCGYDEFTPGFNVLRRSYFIEWAQDMKKVLVRSNIQFSSMLR